MKLTLILILFINIQAIADVYSQTKVTLNLKSADFKKALNSIEKQSSYHFVYSERNIPADKKVNIEVKDVEVTQALNQILANSGFTYNELANHLIVIAPLGESIQADKITGKVLDENGQPLPGASVRIKGATNGTITDGNGNFSIEAPDNATIVVSYITYATREVPVNGRTTLTISLVPASKSLTEVVVTSFGIKKEARSLGYAASTVTAKELTEAGNTNFASALYGKAAGVRIATAPGGASSAVNVQIRGINSLNFNAPPLYVVDGVILRNIGQTGGSGVNNGGFWDDQRIRGNGILDVNPEDIENLTVLKGASATAVYGSDAIGGAIIITTKKGSKAKGLGVDFNYYGTAEQVAFTPKFQNVYGQGYDRDDNIAVGATADGWIADASSPNGLRPNFRPYANFGPKMEGQQVKWWDGSIRSYSPQPDNYKNIFRTGSSSLANLAISNQTDKVNYRFSASRLDYNGIQRASGQQKNTFGLNSSVKLNDKISIDVVANYVNTITHNRPYQTNRLAASYDGFFGREEDMNLVLQKYQTSQGYDWVPNDQSNRNPSEAFIYRVSPNLYDYFWSTLKNTYDENENRLYSSATLNWELTKHLKFRGRIGDDYTGRTTEEKQYNQYPTAFNSSTSSTGYYGKSNGIYSIVYGDALLTYSNKLTSDLDVSVSGGFTSRSEHYNDQSSGTNSGLVSENWFSLNNSYGILSTTATRQSLLKYGYFGILNLAFKNYLFLEGTAREESSSTLPAKNNSYFYPSVNGSFVFTDAFKELPSFFSYGKLRASYGVVGNSAPIYASNILYSQTSLQSINGSVPSLSLTSQYGNDNLMPEKKYESEVGLEARFLNDRIGLDVSYYQNRVKNVIMNLQVAPSNGASSQIVNAGEIGSHGLEVALNAIPVTGKFKWDTRLNFAFNRSKVYSLAPGIIELPFYNAEQNGVVISAKPGEEIGNIYVNPILTDSKGNKVVNSDGYYIIDKTRYVTAGNVLPKLAGGFSNTLSYKNLSLNVLVDYHFGGQIVSPPQKYAIGAGMYESTLKYRDTEHGGLTYYINSSGTKIQLASSSTAGPGNEKVYHDGVLLQGVTEAGNTNTTILDAASYYINSFQWGADALNQEGAVYDNSYIKLREVVLGYKIPNSFAQKLHFSNMRVSLIGRNILYFWRTMKNLDPEAMIGNQWYRQGVDEGSMPATRSFGFALNASF